MGLKGFLSNDMETRELHSDVELRSRYYKTSKKKVQEALEDFCKENDLRVKSYNESLGEMFIQGEKYHVMVSIIQINPLETSVDFKVQTYKLIGMNAPKKLILRLYQFLDSKVPFKGTSLHP
jgi:hypothetical protein